MDLDELLDLFRQFNAKYFESQLQICSIEFTECLPKNSMGHYDDQNNRILIREGLCDVQERITLLHEMIHKRLEQANGHGANFQAELARCAENSCSGFREVILSEFRDSEDFSRFGCSRYTRVERELTYLATKHPGRPWEEIRQCALALSGLTAPEFEEIEEWISALWNFFCGLTSQRPSAPAVGKQKDTI